MVKISFTIPFSNWIFSPTRILRFQSPILKRFQSPIITWPHQIWPLQKLNYTCDCTNNFPFSLKVQHFDEQIKAQNHKNWNSTDFQRISLQLSAHAFNAFDYLIVQFKYFLAFLDQFLTKIFVEIFGEFVDVMPHLVLKLKDWFIRIWSQKCSGFDFIWFDVFAKKFVRQFPFLR